MKNDGATKDYKFGNKNNWRRWNWNRIVENLKATNRTPQDSIVLYLAGEENLDMQVAAGHGFKRENMIAVERIPSVAEKIKSGGVLTITGKLNDVLMSWAGKKQIDVIVADFCWGLTKDAIEFAVIATFHPALKNCIASVNLQRGRDCFSNELRDEWCKDTAESYRNLIAEKIDLKKHRGHLFSICLWGHFWKRDSEMMREKFKDQGKEFWDRVQLTRDRFAAAFKLPSLNSYKSITEKKERKTVVVFDSVVLRTPNIIQHCEFLTGKTACSSLSESQTYKNNNPLIDRNLAASITATLAVRTRRINAFASN